MKLNEITRVLILTHSYFNQPDVEPYRIYYLPQPYSFLDRMGVNPEIGCVWLDEVSDLTPQRMQQFNDFILGR